MVIFLICDTNNNSCHLLHFSLIKWLHLLEVLRWWSATSPSILALHLSLTPGKEARWTTRCWGKSSRSSTTRWQCRETSLLRWHTLSNTHDLRSVKQARGKNLKSHSAMLSCLCGLWSRALRCASRTSLDGQNIRPWTAVWCVCCLTAWRERFMA